MKQSIARISGETYINVAFQKGVRQDVLNKNILFDGCFDVSAYMSQGLHRRFRFVNAQIVYFKGCNKNFPYYVFTPENFPNVEETVFCSHPCERGVFYRFPHVQYWLNDHFKKFAPQKDDISVIPCEYEDVERALAENFKEETVRYGDSIVTKND